jgi:hypothetical protein
MAGAYDNISRPIVSSGEIRMGGSGLTNESISTATSLGVQKFTNAATSVYMYSLTQGINSGSNTGSGTKTRVLLTSSTNMRGYSVTKNTTYTPSNSAYSNKRYRFYDSNPSTTPVVYDTTYTVHAQYPFSWLQPNSRDILDNDFNAPSGGKVGRVGGTSDNIYIQALAHTGINFGNSNNSMGSWNSGYTGSFESGNISLEQICWWPHTTSTASGSLDGLGGIVVISFTQSTTTLATHIKINEKLMLRLADAYAHADGNLGQNEYSVNFMWMVSADDITDLNSVTTTNQTIQFINEGTNRVDTLENRGVSDTFSTTPGTSGTNKSFSNFIKHPSTTGALNFYTAVLETSSTDTSAKYHARNMDQYDDLPTSISAISMSDFYGFTAPRWATSLVVGRVQRSLCFKTCSYWYEYGYYGTGGGDNGVLSDTVPEYLKNNADFNANNLSTYIKEINMGNAFGTGNYMNIKFAKSALTGKGINSVSIIRNSTGQELATARSLGRTSVGNFYNYRLLITGITNLADLYQETITLVLT